MKGVMTKYQLSKEERGEFLKMFSFAAIWCIIGIVIGLVFGGLIGYYFCIWQASRIGG